MKIVLNLLCTFVFLIFALSANGQFKKVNFNKFIKLSESDYKVNLDKKRFESPVVFNNKREVVFSPLDRSSLAGIRSGLNPGPLNDRNVPAYIEGTLKHTGSRGINRKELAMEYVQKASRFMKIKDAIAEFDIVSESEDELGIAHIKMRQKVGSIPIYGAEIILHSTGNKFDFLNGRYFPSPEMDNLIPVLNSNTANDICHKDLDGVQKYDNDLNSVFGDLQTQSELVIYPDKDLFHLAFHVTTYKNIVERWEYFIDAFSGKIINKFQSICKFHNHKHDGGEKCELVNEIMLDGTETANALDLFNVNRLINTYKVGTKFYMLDGSRDIFTSTPSQLPDDPEGVIWTINAFNSSPQKSNFNYDHVTSNNNSWDNKTAVSAHFNGGKAFEYFRTVHNRKSINGAGGNIVSLINVADDDGASMGNAFWNGAAMFYGNGDNAFLSLARGLDVAGHEMTHGVVQSTANLEYQGESGALNESFADVFGVLIDRDDWKIGEDVVKASAFPSGALRSMEDPHNGAGTNDFDSGWQPKHYNERYKNTEDNGGVHINSGIPNHAFFLFANAVGKDKAEKVYFRALSNYLTKSSDFTDCRIAVIKAATDLFGTTEISAAKKAFDDVGIFGDQAGDYEVDNQTNPGLEFILATNSVNSGLFLYTISGISLGQVSNTEIASKPSITDDGSEIVFVGADNKIHYIFIDWTKNPIVPQEQIIGSSPVWRNAVISKDGFKIAALTTVETNEINVFDFSSNPSTSNTFTLYNPTFSEGVTTGDVNYADAMEFDITGEYIMYDAENEISSNTSGSIIYWDISFIRVWNNESNSYSLGKIEKLFSSLPNDVSVGNPVFSKNSPYIISFDYIDENSDVSILGSNTETGDVKLIYENNTLGYPNYSSKDNQLVFDNDGSGTTINTGLVILNNNKIESASVPVLFISNSRWAVWFSNGKRVLSSSEETSSGLGSGIKLKSNPVHAEVEIEFNTVINEHPLIKITNTLGQVIYQNTHFISSDKTNILINSDHWLPDTYFLNVTINDKTVSIPFIKM